MNFIFADSSDRSRQCLQSTHFEAAADSDDVEITTASRSGAVSTVAERAEIG